ncbi:MAG: hypothetical protein C4524_09485 [Candidatus Zixiibacteriota bacterium]|nr:MAG: hypothetical protein C4524_09485 [candidate division Zixibacteria bacterium]
MQRAGWVLAAVLILSLPASAQRNFQGGLHLMLGFPMGEFGDNVDKVGLGLSGEFLWSPRTAPLSLGLSLAGLMYGSETRREPFSPGIPDVTVEVERNNSIILFHGLVRVMPKSGALRPYAEGLAGFSYLFTQTAVRNLGGFIGGNEVASSTNLDDLAFSGGAGAGLMIRVYEGQRDRQGQNIFIDLRGRYLWGGEAEYLTEGSVSIVNGEVFYDPDRSRTDLLLILLGVTGEF